MCDFFLFKSAWCWSKIWLRILSLNFYVETLRLSRFGLWLNNDKKSLWREKDNSNCFLFIRIRSWLWMWSRSRQNMTIPGNTRNTFISKHPQLKHKTWSGRVQASTHWVPAVTCPTRSVIVVVIICVVPCCKIGRRDRGWSSALLCLWFHLFFLLLVEIMAKWKLSFDFKVAHQFITDRFVLDENKILHKGEEERISCCKWKIL